jgi:hypothetical protein
MKFGLARKIADAVLYEGYVLYPYRASSTKNRYRWQWGIVAPRAWSEQVGEPCVMQTEVLIEPGDSPVLEAAIRFLQVQQRPAQGEAPAWEEGVERTFELPPIALRDIPPEGVHFHFNFPPIQAVAHALVRAVTPLVAARLRIENLTDLPVAADRSAAIQRSLTGAHTLLSISGGQFVSLMDPPLEARAAAETCENLHTWPVLVGREGDRTVMLSSPIILQDYPAIAPESHGDFFDATEIDELLTLRVMTLTDEEKREACATDDRARHIIERSDSIPNEVFERLHGALRFFNPPGENPERATINVGGCEISKGATVRLAPRRRADTMDFFLAGRTATIQAVHRDVEDKVYVAVTVNDDPAADLHEGNRRFFYFYPDELEPE